MDKIGIPRGLFYYYYGDIWKNYFDYLNISYIVSPNTNKEIMERGINIANDEMCQALKIYLGHVDYLKDKCEYILVPRVDNYKLDNQMCTNFLSAYDIISNIFDMKLLNYNIDLKKHQTLKKGLISISKKLNIKKRDSIKAYKYALGKYKEKRGKEIEDNLKKLRCHKKRILIVGHPYITYDNLAGAEIIEYLEKNKIAVIFSDKFDSKITNKLSEEISKDLYFKYSKENIGSIVYSKNKIHGIIFLSAFPCALDSLANEMAMRKTNIPFINIVVDDNLSFAGIETRLESFIDVLKGDLYE